jgi:hypothetical protein
MNLAGVELVFHFFRKAPWAHFLWTALGPDWKSDLICETRQKTGWVPSGGEPAFAFPEKSSKRCSCEQLLGLTWKMTSLARLAENRNLPTRLWHPTCHFQNELRADSPCDHKPVFQNFASAPWPGGVPLKEGVMLAITPPNHVKTHWNSFLRVVEE